MNIAGLLSNAARSFADRPAVSLGLESRLSYGELGHRVAVLASNITKHFCAEASGRVALGMTNCSEYVEVLFGVWHAGHCAVPMNAKLHQREFAHILTDSGAQLCFVTPDLAATIAPLADEIETLTRVICVGDAEYRAMLNGDGMPLQHVVAIDPAWLFYTSGTTGRPKGATLSHRNLLAMTLSHLADVDTITEHDCIIHAAPMSHGSGLYVLPHVAKAANHVIPTSGFFNPDELLDLIGYFSGASCFLAPTMMMRLIVTAEQTDRDTSNLKTLIYGGGPMYVDDLKRALDRLGPTLVQIYGQGESPMTITYLSKKMHADTAHPHYRDHLASVGIPRTGIEIRVSDEDDQEVAPGEIGEVLVRGETVMQGYWRNPDATSAALRGGWLHTGDLGVRDERGFLTLKDRAKDLIISGGSNIYPREIEEVLLQHGHVQEVAVIGRPHAEWGEEVVAFVVPTEGCTISATDLDQVCLDHIARFKRPRQYHFINDLPKNNYGKVLKAELRRALAAETASG